jgi:hypothetical protein
MIEDRVREVSEEGLDVVFIFTLGGVLCLVELRVSVDEQDDEEFNLDEWGWGYRKIRVLGDLGGPLHSQLFDVGHDDIPELRDQFVMVALLACPQFAIRAQ